MLHMRKLTLILTFAVLFAGSVSAQIQIPDTPAGRQFSAWLTAFNSGDRATMQQFFDKSMTFGRIEQDMTMRNQTGGFTVNNVEESTDTRIVVQVQERGPGKQLLTIMMSVAATEPYQVAGLRFGMPPPPEPTGPKMTDSEAAEARKGVPFRRFSAWLEAFNSGDRARMQQFVETSAVSMNADAQMNFRERTGGFELRALERATATTLSGLVQERDSDQFGRFQIEVEAAEPNRIMRFPINAIPRPAEFPESTLNVWEFKVTLYVVPGARGFEVRMPPMSQFPADE